MVELRAERGTESHVIQSGVANSKLSSVSVVQLCKGKLSNTCTCGTVRS